MALCESIYKVFGHEKIESYLSKSITANKVFPTWVFHGPSGVGKFKMALKFAKCLLSMHIPREETLDIDLNDRVHSMIHNRIHPDFFDLSNSKANVSIDDTREIMQKIRKTSSESKWKVVVLENASNLNKNTYNSMLKILEEPPDNTVIIMICENLGSLPKTLLSRASKVEFKPLSAIDLLDTLKTQNVDSNSVRVLSELSMGSAGRAMHIYENDGIALYNRLLQSFDVSITNENYKKFIKYYLENKIDFELIKHCIIKILHTYICMLSELIVCESSQYCSSLRSLAEKNRNIPDYAIKKAHESIISLYKSEAEGLDKASVLTSVFQNIVEL